MGQDQSLSARRRRGGEQDRPEIARRSWWAGKPVKWLALSAAVAATALPPVTKIAAATEYVWTHATPVDGTDLTLGYNASGSWATGGNWSPTGPAGGVDNTANFGTLDVGADSTITLDGSRTIGNLVFGDTATISKAGWIVNGDTLTLDVSASTPTITVNTLGGTKVATINSVVAGNDGLAKAGGGGLVLATSNTFSGALSVNAGSLTLQGNNPYGGATTINSGTLTLSGSGVFSATSGVTINVGGQLLLDNSAQNNTNRLVDTATVTMNGGALQVKCNTTVGASFSETIGKLELSSGNSVINSGKASGGTSVLTFNAFSRSAGTTVNFSGTSLGTANNKVMFNDTSGFMTGGGIMGGWAIAGNDFATYDATNGVAALGTYTTTAENTWTSLNNVKLTGGTTTLSASRAVNSLNIAQSSALTLDLNGGTLRVASGGVIASGAQTATIRNGTLTAGAGSNTAGELIIHGNANPAGAAGVRIESQIADNGTGAVSVVKNGTGSMVVLAGSNSYTGRTFVNTGVLRIENNSALGAGGGVNQGTVVVSQAKVELADGINVQSETITLNGTGTVSSLTGALVSADSAAATWGGNIILGSQQVGLGGGKDGSLTIGGTISGGFSDGQVIFSRAGTSQKNSTTVLSGQSNYSGATVVGNNGDSVYGTLKIDGGDDRLPTGTSLVVSGARQVLDLNRWNQTLGALSGNGSVTNNGGNGTLSKLTIHSTADATFSGVIQDGTGTVGLIKDGSFTQTLTGVNTYTGSTTINSGTMELSGSGSIASDVINVAGGTFKVRNVTGGYTLSAGKTITGSGTIDGNITVAGNVSPGNFQGTLHVVGNYLETSTAVTTIELASASQFDVVAVTGTAGLHGTYQIKLLNGYVPDGGTHFDVLTATGGITMAGVSFDFTGASLPSTMKWETGVVDLGGGGEALRLSAVVPEPASLGLMGVSSLLLLSRRRRRSAVAEAGGGDAEGVETAGQERRGWRLPRPCFGSFVYLRA